MATKECIVVHGKSSIEKNAFGQSTNVLLRDHGRHERSLYWEKKFPISVSSARGENLYCTLQELIV